MNFKLTPSEAPPPPHFNVGFRNFVTFCHSKSVEISDRFVRIFVQIIFSHQAISKP